MKNQAAALTLRAFGKILRNVRKRAGLTGEALAARLEQYGCHSADTQQKVSEIELGQAERVIDEFVLDAWLRTCGVAQNDALARAARAYRELVERFVAASGLVPVAIDEDDYNNTSIVIAEMSTRGPGEIQSAIEMLKEGVMELAWRHYVKVADQETAQ